jgi:hypothetical protein
MRDGRLGEVNTLLYVARAQPRLFSDGAGSLDLEDLQDLAPGGIGDSIEESTERLILRSHGVEIEGKLTDVNVVVSNQ